MKNILKSKGLIWAVPVVLLLCIGIIFYSFGFCTTPAVTIIAMSATEETALIAQKDTVSQSFVCPVDQMGGVSLRAGLPQGKPESGAMVCVLTDENGNILATERIEAKKIRNNAPFAIGCDTIPASKGKSYTIQIQAEDIPAKTPIVLKGGAEDENAAEAKLTLADGSDGQGALLFLSVSHNVIDYPVDFLVLAIIFALAFLPSLILANNGKGEKKQ